MVGGKEQTAKTLSAIQERKNKIDRRVMSLGIWHVDFTSLFVEFQYAQAIGVSTSFFILQ
jgi:hypothetical protein